MAAEASADGQIFTRGKPGDPDSRGESLVQKHQQKVQQEKEDAALDKLASLMPQMGSMVRALALTKSNWDVESALSMLRQFQVACLDKLNAVTKKRKRIREELENEDGAGLESDSDSGASSSSGSEGKQERGGSGSESGGGSGSDSEQDKKKKRRKKSSKSDKKRSSSKKSKKEKEKQKRSSSSKHKKAKRSRKEAGSGDSDSDEGGRKALVHSQDYGKFGVLRDTDRASKGAEFILWAMDEQKVNPDLLGQREEKELWEQYREEYNTGTLPHRKYYDLEAYERRAALKAAKERGGKGGKERKRTAADDEAEMKRRRMEERQKAAEARLKEAYNEMQRTGKAGEMRQQEMLRAEMNLAYKTGDKARAQRLYDRLAPDDKK